MSNTKPLNVRQERFATLVAGGMPASPAYIQAGYKVSEKVARTSGPRLLAFDSVASRIAAIRSKAEKKAEQSAFLSIAEKREFLAAVIRTPIGEVGPGSVLCAEYSSETSAGGVQGKLKRGAAAAGNEKTAAALKRTRVKTMDKLRAIELDSKLAGHFAPDELVVETGQKTLESIKERAAKVVSALDRTARGTIPATTGGVLSRWKPAPALNS